MDNSTVELNKSDFAAFSSETRINILKLLDSNKLTLSQISEITGHSPSTISGHLDILENSGLVQSDTARKWHYYSLTRKSKTLLHPEYGSKVILLFAAELFSGFMLYIFALSYSIPIVYQGPAYAEGFHDPIYLILTELTLAVMICIAYVIYKRFKNKEKLLLNAVTA